MPSLPETTDQSPRRTIVYWRRPDWLFHIGGLFLLCLMRAYLFKWHHPDRFYEIMALLCAVIGGTGFAFPVTLVLAPERLRMMQFGRAKLDIPWTEIRGLTLYRTGKARGLGLTLAAAGPETRRVVRLPPSGGYDVALVSIWNRPIAEIAAEAARCWRAVGGSGVVDELTPPSVFRFEGTV
jgi:hypothetical protein